MKRIIYIIVLLFVFSCINYGAERYNPGYNTQQQSQQYYKDIQRSQYNNEQRYYQPNNYYDRMVPASRYYTNPYDFPPQNRYPYNDDDRYYKPQTSYNTMDDEFSASDRY